MLRLDRILGVGRSDRVFLVLRRNPHDVRGKARREDCDEQQCDQNSEGCFHGTIKSRTPNESDVQSCVPGGKRADGSRASWTLAAKGERTGVSESIEVRA